MKKISLISAPSILVASAVVALGTWATPAWAFAPFTVKNIEIRGLEHIAPGTVYNYLPIHIGEEIDDQKAQEAIKGLYATGFFKDVSIARSGDTLLVIVQERPIISSIKLEGVKAFSKDEGSCVRYSRASYCNGKFTVTLADGTSEELSPLSVALILCYGGRGA